MGNEQGLEVEAIISWFDAKREQAEILECAFGDDAELDQSARDQFGQYWKAFATAIGIVCVADIRNICCTASTARGDRCDTPVFAETLWDENRDDGCATLSPALERQLLAQRCARHIDHDSGYPNDWVLVPYEPG